MYTGQCREDRRGRKDKRQEVQVQRGRRQEIGEAGKDNMWLETSAGKAGEAGQGRQDRRGRT